MWYIYGSMATEAQQPLQRYQRSARRLCEHAGYKCADITYDSSRQLTSAAAKCGHDMLATQCTTYEVHVGCCCCRPHHGKEGRQRQSCGANTGAAPRMPTASRPAADWQMAGRSHGAEEGASTVAGRTAISMPTGASRCAGRRIGMACQAAHIRQDPGGNSNSDDASLY